MRDLCAQIDFCLAVEDRRQAPSLSGGVLV